MLTRFFIGTVFCVAVGAIPLKAATRSIEWCGVIFRAPAGWILSDASEDEHTVSDMKTEIKCTFSLRPGEWPELDSQSKWGAGDPLVISIYTPDASWQEALEDYFDRNEDGQFGVGGRFSFSVATPFRRGAFKGLVAYRSFRGFAKEGAALPEDDSRRFTGESEEILVKNRAGRVVALRHACGSSDVHVDCHAAIGLFLDSLKFQRHRSTPQSAK